VDKKPQGAGPESPERAHRASVLEDWLHSLRARWVRRLGHRAHIVPFSGYGTTTEVRVLCRVLLLKPRTTVGGTLRRVRGWRSFLGVPVVGARVNVSLGGHTVVMIADRGGVVDDVAAISLTPGWSTATLVAEKCEPVEAQIFVVAPEVKTGIVCDVDDTIMVTALPRPFLATWNSFVRDEHARRPVPGMAVLLERLTQAHPDAPVIYLSTGAWNVAPTLHRFLTRHLYPRGAFLLTDWGPTHDRWFRSGREHKRRSLARLAVEFPHIRWILIGDDGQHDEGLYGEFAMAHPDNVAAIAIRELRAPEALLAGGRRHLDRTHNPITIPWVSAPNGSGLAAELKKLGVLHR